MVLQCIPAGPYATNCYLLANEAGECLIIDAPPESFAQAKELWTSKNWKPIALILTHAHWDHMLDAHIFQKEGIPVYAHEKSVEQLKHPETLAWLAPDGLDFKGVHVDQVCQPGKAQMGSFNLEFFHTPGHCPGSLCIYLEKEFLCFTGDLIFQDSVGRSDLPGGDKVQLSESIQKCIYSLPDPVSLYPGHGGETTVAHERQFNPYIVDITRRG